MNRADFIAKVRASLGTAPPDPGEIPALDVVRLADARSGGAERFAAAATAAGMKVMRVRESALVEHLCTTLRHLDARHAVVRMQDGQLRDSACTALSRSGALPVDPPANAGLDSQFDADVGITDVAAAVAESGSLVLASLDQGRGAFLLPPVHIALVRASNIVPDLLDLWPARAAPPPLPASMVLVSGPSKTADIEGILITGVHGPREVRVFLIEPDHGTGTPPAPTEINS